MQRNFLDALCELQSRSAFLYRDRRRIDCANHRYSCFSAKRWLQNLRELRVSIRYVCSAHAASALIDRYVEWSVPGLVFRQSSNDLLESQQASIDKGAFHPSVCLTRSFLASGEIDQREPRCHDCPVVRSTPRQAWCLWT